MADWCPVDWKPTKLSELGKIDRGRSRHRPRYASHLYGGPYPFIQTGDIKASGGKITKYSQTYSEAGLAQSRLWPAGTLCITIAANIAETGLLTFPACFPDSVVGFIADDSKADVNFVEYMFRYLRNRIQHEATGSVQDNINLATLERLQFPTPELPEQRAIARILSALDDKIEVNHRINITLEFIVRTVFRQWFVESDEVGGWEVGKFNDISDISRETIAPNQFPDETFNHYSIPAFDEKQFPKKELGIEIMSNKFLVSNSCVLISKLNPETQRIWLPFQIEGRSICSTEFLVNTPKNCFSMEYLYGLFSSQPFQDIFISMITGTSGSHQRVKAGYLLDMDAQIPPKELIVKYTETVKPLLQKVKQNILESRTLASLRDSLLPKLMRGEVRVRLDEEINYGQLSC